MIGLEWRFCAKTGTGDPGAGGLRFNGDAASTTSTISISDACVGRRNPDVSRYVATWDKSSSAAHRGTLIITSLTRDALAIFEIVGTSTDCEGWTELDVRAVQSFDTFANHEAVGVQFLRSGDAAEVIGGTTIALQPAGDVEDLRAQVRQLEVALSAVAQSVHEIQRAMSALVIEATH